jgi:bifunctional UDP-N-acetylglucosamine pyrophosphorylase/glucosamine-1-phosphate N-acetyltransferase
MPVELNVVLLAAGQGKRMKSSLPKVLHPLAGLPLIEHSLRAVAGVTDRQPVVVVGHGAKEVQAAVGDKARFVLQEQQLGTAHALRMAEPLLAKQPGLLLVTYGDMPLLTSATLQRLVDLQRANSGPISMLTVIMDDPHGFGRIVRGADGSIQAIVEEAQASPEILAIHELNVGVYCFDSAWLWQQLPNIPLSPKGEYYLTDIVAIAVAQGLKNASLIVADPEETLGINTRAHLAEAESVLRRRINLAWMLAGISILDPQTTYIEADVKIGVDTRILPGSSLTGGTVVGAGCQIGPHTVLANSRLGDGCVVSASWLENSDLPNGARIGPYAHLKNHRPGRSVQL